MRVRNVTSQKLGPSIRFSLLLLIACASEKALSAAHLDAVKTILARTTDEAKKQKLTWLSNWLELETNGSKHLSKEVLAKYVGSYASQIVVSLDGDQLLFLGASGIKRKLLALSEDYFIIEDLSVQPLDQARLRFIRNADGNVTELQLVVSDGRTFSRAREVK